MMIHSAVRTVCLIACAVATPSAAAILVFEATGADPASITAARDGFRSAVGGGSIAGANGDFGGIRREINWDGVPAGFSDPTLLPADFFNVNSPRGAVFSTPGTGFLVSGAQSPLFGFPGDLQTFSAAKLFATVGSNVMDITFLVPGTLTASTTTAFGAVFVDAETPDQTKMEFFDASNALLFTRFVLTGNNQALSFLGGVANAGEQISRVRITMPNNYLLSNGARLNESDDFVVMDDFLYATPAANGIPEPGSAWLLGTGLLAAGLAARRR